MQMQVSRYNNCNFDIKCHNFHDNDILLWITSKKTTPSYTDLLFIIDNSNNMFDTMIHSQYNVPLSPKSPHININDLHNIISPSSSPIPYSKQVDRISSPSMISHDERSLLTSPDSPKIVNTQFNKNDVIKHSITNMLNCISCYDHTITVITCNSSFKMVCNKVQLTTDNVNSINDSILKELTPHGSVSWSSIFEYINNSDHDNIIICTTDESLNLFRSTHTSCETKKINMKHIHIVSIGILSITNINFFNNCYVGLTADDVTNKLLSVVWNIGMKCHNNIKITIIDNVDDDTNKSQFKMAIDDKIVNNKSNLLIQKMKKKERKLVITTFHDVKSNVIQLDSIVIAEPIIILLNKHSCITLEYDDIKFTFFTEILLQNTKKSLLTDYHCRIYKQLVDVISMFELIFESKSNMQKRLLKINTTLRTELKSKPKDDHVVYLDRVWSLLENKSIIYYNILKQHKDIARIGLIDCSLLRNLKIREFIVNEKYETKSTLYKIPIIMERGTCRVCKVNNMNLILYPCKHTNICDTCMNYVSCCPACKLEITYVKKITICNLEMKCLECKTNTVTACLVCTDKHANTYFCIKCSNGKLKKHKCNFKVNNKVCKNKMIGILDFYLVD